MLHKAYEPSLASVIIHPSYHFRITELSPRRCCLCHQRNFPATRYLFYCLRIVILSGRLQALGSVLLHLRIGILEVRILLPS